MDSDLRSINSIIKRANKLEEISNGVRGRWIYIFFFVGHSVIEFTCKASIGDAINMHSSYHIRKYNGAYPLAQSTGQSQNC